MRRLLTELEAYLVMAYIVMAYIVMAQVRRLLTELDASRAACERLQDADKSAKTLQANLDACRFTRRLTQPGSDKSHLFSCRRVSHQCLGI